jgi:hypothetical protein
LTAAATGRRCAPRCRFTGSGAGLTHVRAPLLTGAAAFRADAPQSIEAWLAEFLAALAEEAEAGIALLHLLERQ